MKNGRCAKRLMFKRPTEQTNELGVKRLMFKRPTEQNNELGVKREAKVDCSLC